MRTAVSITVSVVLTVALVAGARAASLGGFRPAAAAEVGPAGEAVQAAQVPGDVQLGARSVEQAAVSDMLEVPVATVPAELTGEDIPASAAAEEVVQEVVEAPPAAPLAPAPPPPAAPAPPAPVATPPPAPVATPAPTPAPQGCPENWFCYPRLGVAGPIVPYDDCLGRTDIGTGIRSFSCLSPFYIMGHAYTQFGAVTGWQAGDVVFAWGRQFVINGAFVQNACEAPARALAPLSLQTSLTSSSCGRVLIVQGS